MGAVEVSDPVCEGTLDCESMVRDGERELRLLLLLPVLSEAPGEGVLTMPDGFRAVRVPSLTFRCLCSFPLRSPFRKEEKREECFPESEVSLTYSDEPLAGVPGTVL